MCDTSPIMFLLVAEKSGVLKREKSGSKKKKKI